MIPTLRTQFNQSFTQEKYRRLLAQVHPHYDAALDFRIAETPVFADKAFKKELLNLFEEVKTLLSQKEFTDKMSAAVPQKYAIPNETPFPEFVTIDAAVCQNPDGSFYPQLIELQGTASLYCYQRHLCEAYRDIFSLDPSLSPFLSSEVNYDNYTSLLKKVIVGESNPENVVLLDVAPQTQKTRIDFHYTLKDLQINAICISEIIQEGSSLYYKKNGKKIRIHRIYNRLIFDELERTTGLEISFDWTKPADVAWITHPNWFFKLSKYSMPFMESKYIPKTDFLHTLKSYPEDLSRYVLKPLFSFAGAGVQFDVTPEILAKVETPENYILQKKVDYAPFLPTPNLPAKAEIRILCLHDKTLIPFITLARLSKGKILGVDFNKDNSWVGGSAIFFEK